MKVSWTLINRLERELEASVALSRSLEYKCKRIILIGIMLNLLTLGISLGAFLNSKAKAKELEIHVGKPPVSSGYAKNL